jgi:nickel superoxide dismutase
MQRMILAGLSLAGLIAVTALTVIVADTPRAQAHCQVPCGIYDDPARIAHLREDAQTIEKASKLIQELAGKHDPIAFNQAARWVRTKEDHASHIIEVVAQYFLTQKVKPVAKGSAGYDAYLAKLADHHAVMSAAMKCKQNVGHQLRHGIAQGHRSARDALLSTGGEQSNQRPKIKDRRSRIEDPRSRIENRRSGDFSIGDHERGICGSVGHLARLSMAWGD